MKKIILSRALVDSSIIEVKAEATTLLDPPFHHLLALHVASTNRDDSLICKLISHGVKVDMRDQSFNAAFSNKGRSHEISIVPRS